MGQILTHTPTHNAKGAEISARTKEEDAADHSAGVLARSLAHIACEIRFPIVAAACSCILSVAWV